MNNTGRFLIYGTVEQERWHICCCCVWVVVLTCCVTLCKSSRVNSLDHICKTMVSPAPTVSTTCCFLMTGGKQWIGSTRQEERTYLIWFFRDSSVGIALGFGLDGFDSRRGLGIFLVSTALGPTQPPIQWLPGALPLGVKRPGRETDHSHLSSVETKECVELYLHSSNTPSWRRSQLKEQHMDEFTFTCQKIAYNVKAHKEL